MHLGPLHMGFYSLTLAPFRGYSSSNLMFFPIPLKAILREKDIGRTWLVNRIGDHSFFDSPFRLVRELTSLARHSALLDGLAEYGGGRSRRGPIALGLDCFAGSSPMASKVMLFRRARIRCFVR